MYIPTHFTLTELMPKRYLHVVSSERLWATFDPNLLSSLDILRDYVGKKIYINYNSMQCRGYRDCVVCGEVGGALSPHRLGRAVDLNIEGMDSEEVFHMILRKQHLFTGVRRMEDISKTPTWIHIDTIETDQSSIKVF